MCLCMAYKSSKLQHTIYSQPCLCFVCVPAPLLWLFVFVSHSLSLSLIVSRPLFLSLSVSFTTLLQPCRHSFCLFGGFSPPTCLSVILLFLPDFLPFAFSPLIPAFVYIRLPCHLQPMMLCNSLYTSVERFSFFFFFF